MPSRAARWTAVRISPAAVVGDDLGGEDVTALVEPGGERADGLSPFVEEPQVRVVAAAALEAALAALGGVGDALVQVAEQVRALGEDGGEGHRGADGDEGGADEEQQPRAQRTSGPRRGSGASGEPGPSEVHLPSSTGRIAYPTPRTVWIIGVRPLSIFRRRLEM